MNPFWLFLVVGVGLVGLELLVFQFSTFWLFFFGVGALVAAVFAWLSVDASYMATTVVFILSSAAITALLLKPLKNWQQQPSALADNNAIGQKVEVEQTVSADQDGVVSWSGSDWQAALADGQVESLQAGDSARVVSIEGIKLFIAKA